MAFSSLKQSLGLGTGASACKKILAIGLNNDRRQQQQCRFSSEFSHSLWTKKSMEVGEKALMDILLLWGRFLRPSARVSLFPRFFSWVLFSLPAANNQRQQKKRKQSLSIFVILARLRKTDFN